MSGASLRGRPPRITTITAPERNPLSGRYAGDSHAHKERHGDDSPRRRSRPRRPTLVASAAGVAAAAAMVAGVVVATGDERHPAATGSAGNTVTAIWEAGDTMGVFTLDGTCDGVGACTVTRPILQAVGGLRVDEMNAGMAMQLTLTDAGYYEATTDIVELPTDADGCTPPARTFSLRVVVSEEGIEGTLSAPRVECYSANGNYWAEWSAFTFAFQGSRS